MSQTTTSREQTTRRVGGFIRNILPNTGPLAVLLVMFLGLWLTAPAFRTPTGLLLIGLEAAAIGVVAVGQTFVILTGGIDLSVEAMVSFSGVVAAILIAGTNIAGGPIAHGIPAWAAILIAVAAGALVGVVQGLLITAFRINPLIVTLGFRSMLLGVSLVWTRGAGINIQKDGFLEFLTGYVNMAGLRIPMPRVRAAGADQPVPRGDGRWRDRQGQGAGLEARRAGARQRGRLRRLRHHGPAAAGERRQGDQHQPDRHRLGGDGGEGGQ